MDIVIGHSITTLPNGMKMVKDKHFLTPGIWLRLMNNYLLVDKSALEGEINVQEVKFEQENFVEAERIFRLFQLYLKDKANKVIPFLHKSQTVNFLKTIKLTSGKVVYIFNILEFRSSNYRGKSPKIDGEVVYTGDNADKHAESVLNYLNIYHNLDGEIDTSNDHFSDDPICVIFVVIPFTYYGNNEGEHLTVISKPRIVTPDSKATFRLIEDEKGEYHAEVIG